MSRYLSNNAKSYDIAKAVNYLSVRQEPIDVTLNNSTTTTTIEDSRIGTDTMVVLMPVSAASAAETPYFTVTAGQVVITHSNDVTTREFKMGLIG